MIPSGIYICTLWPWYVRLHAIVLGRGVPLHDKCSHCVRTAISSPAVEHDNGVVVCRESSEAVSSPVPCNQCGPGSHAVTKCVDLCVLLKPKKTRSIEMTLTFSIINTQYDMVIGLQDIRKYDLTRRCRELFSTPPINNPKDGSRVPSERLTKVSTPESLLECHSTSPARPIEEATDSVVHTSPSNLREEID